MRRGKRREQAEINAKVKCERGRKRVVFTYQQNSSAARCCSRWPPPAHAAPDCFAAAARDPERPCSNPALRLRARPGLTARPADAHLPVPGDRDGRDPNSRIDGALSVCAFGSPAGDATRTVALVGDSHAMAWRAAVAGAFKRLGWHGVDLTRSHCAFSAAVRDLDEPEEVRAACASTSA